MRFPLKALALCALVATQGCAALEFLGGRCTQEQLTVTWPATITRGITVTSVLLVSTLTPANVGQNQFDALRAALTQGALTKYNVTWGVDAFNVNGGFIAFTHATPLSVGETQQINTAFNGGGWGANAVSAAPVAAVSVRADNFTATSATGTLTALNGSPLRLRIDVTTSNAAGETIRLTGEAGFHYDKVTKTCVS